MIKAISIFSFSMLVMYLIVAFTTLHIDFRLWEDGTRCIYAVAGGLISLVITGAILDFENNKKQ
jgi:hypothetical protein